MLYEVGASENKDPIFGMGGIQYRMACYESARNLHCRHRWIYNVASLSRLAAESGFTEETQPPVT